MQRLEGTALGAPALGQVGASALERELGGPCPVGAPPEISGRADGTRQVGRLGFQASLGHVRSRRGAGDLACINAVRAGMLIKV